MIMTSQNSQICDACRRLRIKCQWLDEQSFTPRCARCSTYGLSCVIESLSWTSNAVRAYKDESTETVSRNIFWGPSSNAAGHPLDLHTPKAPLSTPEQLGGQRSSTSDSATSLAQVPLKLALNISPRVREHLYSVFFEYIQPTWPVVTYDSLASYPPTTLLDAAILGVAARHRMAIASWRDFVHIKDVIEAESRELFGLRQPYEPLIQTVQALLVTLLRLEIWTRGHSDFQRLSFSVTFACNMARELGLHKLGVTGDIRNMELKQVLWAACIIQDTYMGAALGQPLNTTNAHDLEISRFPLALGQPIPTLSFLGKYQFFGSAFVLSRCLRSVLRMAYRTIPYNGDDLATEASGILNQVRSLAWHLTSEKAGYDIFTWQCLQMMLNNIHLLFILGLKSTLQTIHTSNGQLQQMIAQESGLLVTEACQTLEYSTPEFLSSSESQNLTMSLYSTSRALMVVVDVLRDARSNPTHSMSLIENLNQAVKKAQVLMDFLLAERSWSGYWTQGHTLKAILARLNLDVLGDGQGPIVTNYDADQQGFVQATDNKDNLPPVDEFWRQGLDGTQISNAILNPTDWDDFLAQYNQDFDWIQFNEFDESQQL